MRPPTATRAAALLLLSPTLAVSAFASASQPRLPIRVGDVHRSLHRTSRCHHHSGMHRRTHQNEIHRQQATKLHLSIPRGGAVASAAATKLSELTSTPTGTFNAALAVLAAGTAALKVYGKVGEGNKEDGGEVVSVCLSIKDGNTANDGTQQLLFALQLLMLTSRAPT